MFQKNYVPLHPLTSKQSGFSAVGSAHVWGARGRWFESSNPDSIEDKELKHSNLSSVWLKKSDSHRTVRPDKEITSELISAK